MPVGPDRPGTLKIGRPPVKAKPHVDQVDQKGLKPAKHARPGFGQWAMGWLNLQERVKESGSVWVRHPIYIERVCLGQAGVAAVDSRSRMGFH